MSAASHATSAPASVSLKAQRWRLALLLYLVLTAVYAVMLPRQLWSQHTPFNHYALQAEAWLGGSLGLPGQPPGYTGNNDFARYNGIHYVSFPPGPALLIAPAVALSGSAEKVADGRFFLWFSALGPALFWLLLEALRRDGRVHLSERHNWLLAATLGLGTVYWFCAVQGTVWFAGHVVAMAALCAYLLCSVRARFPLLAGLSLAFAVGTRPSMALAVPFFVHEWLHACRSPSCAADKSTTVSPATGPLGDFDSARGKRLAVPFIAALLVGACLLMWHNWARFDSPFVFGHRHLTVVWRKRIDEWGLFSLHYLGRNLAIMLTSLPFWSKQGLQVNGHGLALWLTTPIYLWALWPRRTSSTFWVCAASAAAMALTVLLYQNSGWLQFGYRFSNDFAPLLLMMVALSGHRLTRGFWALALWGVAINAFGALTFGNPDYRHRYFIDTSQRIIQQPD